MHDGNWDELAPLLTANGYDTVFYMAAYGPVIDEEGLRECLDSRPGHVCALLRNTR